MISLKGSQGRPSEGREAFKKFNISLPPEIYKRLNNFSEKEDRAKSWIIKKALEDYLAKNGY